MSRPSDATLLDSPNGPEFSVRVVGVCARHDVRTIAQLREQLPNLEKWKGLGRKSINEIKGFFDWYDNPQGDLLTSQEFMYYTFEERLGSVQAIMQDVERYLLRAALRRGIAADTRQQLVLKLTDAAQRISQLPIFVEDK